jgi:hypothetical protein
MMALFRYAGVDLLRSQRWVAPVLSFAAIVAIISTQTGSVLPTYAVAAGALLFIATWIAIVTVNDEDPIQQSITIVNAGSQSKVRMAKLLFAFSIAATLGFVGMIGPPLASSSRTTIGDVLAGASAQLITTLAGVALGALCSRPIINRRAWSVLIGFGNCLLTLIVPYAPPTRQLLVLFNRTGSFVLGASVLLIALETVLIAGVAVVVSLRISRRIS